MRDAKRKNETFRSLFSAAVGLAFVSVAIGVLNFGHLYEDAYILFQYSRNVSSGRGVVFDSLSGPAEGATDFLWMIALAGLHRLGIDIGSAAALLNGMGLSLITFVIFKIRGYVDVKSFSVVSIVVFSGGTVAALGGFSTLAYGGLFALFTLALLEHRYSLVAILSVVLPLFRPDAAFLVLGGIIAILLFTQKDERRLIAFALLPSILVGITYFSWRFWYFGLLLPLPLLVKSTTDKLLDGADTSFYALRAYVPLLLLIAWYLISKGKRSLGLFRSSLTIVLGPLLLFLALLFAHQSQNIGYRFQFPIIIALSLIYLNCDKKPGLSKAFLVCWLFCVLFGARLILNGVQSHMNGDYMNSFPQLLRAQQFRVENIAVTEAGRFPFWFNCARITDLIGLNTVNVVRYGPEKVLQQLNPQLIFVTHSGRFDVARLHSAKSYFVADSKDIPLNGEYTGRNPELLAPEAALRFAVSQKYEAVFVHEDIGWDHVFFLSKELDLTQFLSILEKSMRTRIGYYDSLKLN